MGFYQYIGLICLIIAGIIFIGLCATIDSVWLEKPAVLEKHFEKIDKNDNSIVPQLYSHKETKYNNFWKKVWEK